MAPDEELIAYFQEHRADIEELVHRYRTYEPPPPSQDHHLWMKQGDTPERFKRAGLWSIGYTGSVWFPNPYSLETAKQVDATPGFEKHIKHGTIQIRIDDRRFYLNGIWKNLIFIPVVPRIENGVLLGPVDTRGRHFGNLRVAPSLNGEPPDCQRDECVVRQIEPQWFIQMCRIF